MKERKVLKYSLMRNGVTPAVYAFKEPNIWYPVIYFRKAKHADKKIYKLLMSELFTTAL